MTADVGAEVTPAACLQAERGDVGEMCSILFRSVPLHSWRGCRFGPFGGLPERLEERIARCMAEVGHRAAGSSRGLGGCWLGVSARHGRRIARLCGRIKRGGEVAGPVRTGGEKRRRRGDEVGRVWGLDGQGWKRVARESDAFLGTGPRMGWRWARESGRGSRWSVRGKLAKQ